MRTATATSARMCMRKPRCCPLRKPHPKCIPTRTSMKMAKPTPTPMCARTRGGAFFWERLRRFVLLMSLVAIGAFTIAAVSPVDPVSALVKAVVLRLSPEQREQISAKWGLA